MKKAFMMILMMLIATIFLTSCQENTNRHPDPKLDDDTWKTIEKADETEVYKTLIASVMGSIEDLSDKKVSKSQPLLSVDTRMQVELNDFLIWFELKINYDYNNPQNLLLSAEMINAEDEEVILGAYFKDDILYMQVLDGESGRIQFPLKNGILNQLLPIVFNSDLDAKNLAIGLNSIISTNGYITGRTRLNGTTMEEEYTINIDLPSTLRALVEAIDSDIIENLDKDKISTVIQRVIGVSFNDILQGNLPESNMELFFSSFGRKLTQFSTCISVESGGDQQNTLFGGEELEISINLDKLKLEKSFTSIPFFGDNKYLEYPDYTNQNVRVLLNVLEKGQTTAEDIEYLINAELKMNLEQIENNEILFEIIDTENNPVTGIYLKDSMFYYYRYDDETQEYQKQIEFELDIADVFDKISKGIDITLPEGDETDTTQTKAKNTALDYIAYIVGALRVTEDNISFTINSDFYELVLPGIENFLLYADAVIEEDLSSMPETASINQAIDYLLTHAFEISIDLSDEAESFISIINSEIEFPEGVGAEVA